MSYIKYIHDPLYSQTNYKFLPWLHYFIIIYFWYAVYMSIHLNRLFIKLQVSVFLPYVGVFNDH